MIRAAIIILLISYCSSVFSQSLSISRNFPSNRKNIPLEILNNHPHYFYLLRYNKDVHDLIVERRTKPEAEILNICPLRLDSVNAKWFDYEQLDRLFFEYGQHVYFFFERVLNHKRTLFLKSLDSAGRASGFTEIAELEKDKSVYEIKFEYSLTSQKRILIIGTQIFVNESVKKTAFLFDVETRKMVWIKKLPLENVYTGTSRAYMCNESGDLFFVNVKSRLSSFKRKYSGQRQVLLPVFYYETISIISLQGENSTYYERRIPIEDFWGLQSISLFPIGEEVVCNLHYSDKDQLEEEKVYFFNQRLSKNLKVERYAQITALDKKIEEQLTYFDGTDVDKPYDKEFRAYDQAVDNGHLYNFAERRDDNYYKELLVWKVDLESGQVAAQTLIPRKIFYFAERSRFKNIGQPAHSLCGSSIFTFVLESRRNQQSLAQEYSFRSFDKQRQLSGGDLCVYTLPPSGKLIKSTVYKNSEYDMVPLAYQSNQCDFLFYLSKGRAEKFAILRMDPH